MATYKVLSRSFINDRIYEPGTEVEYDGVPGSNLMPVDNAAKEAAKKRPSKQEIAKRLHAAAEAENPDLVPAA